MQTPKVCFGKHYGKPWEIRGGLKDLGCSVHDIRLAK